MGAVKRTAILALLTLGLTGCSIDKHMAEISSKIEKDYDASKPWSQLPFRTISWEQALSILSKQNMDLKRADASIRQLERDSLSVYTDMIPGVSYYGYFNSTLRDLTSAANSNDLSSNINVTFSLPTLTQVPYRLYAAKARTYSVIKAREGKERELVSSLYKLVRLRELSLKQRALEEQARFSASQNAIEAAKRMETEDDKYWQDVAAALGDRSARWNILPESMPHVEWKDYEERTKKLDPLIVCQFALRLEQARMQQYSIALDYLPTINTSLYSPALFSSSGGTYQGTFLSMDDTRLNLSIGYSLDSRLSSWNRYSSSKDEYENTRLDVLGQIADHKNKLATLRKSVKEYYTWRSYMERRLEYVRSTPTPTGDALLERSKLELDMRRELLLQETKAVDSEAAVILEYGMPPKR